MQRAHTSKDGLACKCGEPDTLRLQRRLRRIN